MEVVINSVIENWTLRICLFSYFFGHTSSLTVKILFSLFRKFCFIFQFNKSDIDGALTIFSFSVIIKKKKKQNITTSPSRRMETARHGSQM